ncbi:MAG: hypothetical protein ACK558_15855 [Pseudomonadota bacterium]
MSRFARGPVLLALLAASPLLSAATPPATPRDGAELLAPPKALAIDPAADRVVARGGELAIRWNDELLRDLGMPRRAAVYGSDVTLRIPLSKSTRIEADVLGRSVRPFSSGSGELQASFFFVLPGGGALAWRHPRFVVRPGEALRLDFAADDGQALFYGDHLMYGLSADGTEIQLRSFDLRIAPQLAERLGRKELTGQAVAEVRGRVPVETRIAAAAPKACGDPDWPGEPVPGVAGAIYQADVFTTGFSASYSRCRSSPAGGTCDGPGGTTDGEIVFTPSSTLLNNVNQGTPVAVVPGDPLGTSTALHAADVEWETKFTNAVSGPYAQFDQHPFLIWNLYRIDPSGAITQVGRSGVKHAWLTINVGAGCVSCNGGHVLGRSCSDTYGTGNNDNSSDLGPRREIIPAKGQWGRCRSIYDINCDGVQNAGGNTNYDQRMRVPESAVDPAANPGASWLFESWYIVRDDINIHNTMATRPFSAAWVGGVWQVTNGSPYRLGSAVARWVASAPAGSVARVDELDVGEGHAQLGLRVTDLGGGSHRYEYALMNLDFARAATAGAEPNLEVLRNNGFDGFILPLAGGVTAQQIVVADGDADAGNDWLVTQANGRLEVRAPADAASLNWGSMLRIGFTASAAPVASSVSLEVTEAGTPAAYALGTLGPARPDGLFADGFE